MIHKDNETMKIQLSGPNS